MPPVTEETPLLTSGKQSPLPPIISLPSRTPTILGVSYASMSGLLSGMCLIFAKSAVELLVLTAAGSNQFLRWESWALVSILIALALLQVRLIYSLIVQPADTRYSSGIYTNRSLLKIRHSCARVSSALSNWQPKFIDHVV